MDIRGAILAGGVIGPALLMYGLANGPAAEASMLLSAEGVFTSLLARFVFRENFDRRIVAGMLAIIGGAIILSWPGDARLSGSTSGLSVPGACRAGLPTTT